MTTGHSRALAVVALVGLVAVAGCAGVLGGDGGDGPGETPTPTDTGPDVDESQLRADALAAMAAVEAYSVDARQDVVTVGPQDRETTVRDRTRVDRTNRELMRNRTVVAQGQRLNYTQYVVDETFYARSEVYVQQVSSEWVRNDLENFSRLWRQQDTLGQLRTVLDNASGVEVTDRETVDGRETYRTRVEITEAAFEQVLFDVIGVDPDETEGVNVSNVEYVYWLDTETARPLRTSAVVRFSATVGGQTITQNVTTTARYRYEPVSVELPDAADTAVNLSSRRVQPAVAPAGGDGPTLAPVDATVGDDRGRVGAPARRP